MNGQPDDPGARLSAAIEVFADIGARRRPAADALKDWGLSHRFAGSGDRAAIAGLVYDALRRRGSSAFLMGEETPRAILLGMLKRERGLDAAAIARLADGSRYAPGALSEAERARLAAADIAGAPPHVLGDYPEWLDPYLARVFGEERAEEGAALASRAPLDLRVNTLKADREAAAASLADLGPEPTRWSPLGFRIRLAAEAKSPAIHAEPAYLKGLVEIQDEGSQLAALLAGAMPGEQVRRSLRRRRRQDLGFGGGDGKQGPALCHRQRQAPPCPDPRPAGTRRRAQRPGPHAEVDRQSSSPISPAASNLVLIDAPCTGIGAWRRNPDAKWRVRPGAIEVRIKEQVAALERAVTLVRPGGRIAYVTCSVLDEENGAQVRTFIARHPDFSVEKPADTANALGERAYLVPPCRAYFG